MKADKLLYVLLGKKLCTSMLDDVQLNHYAHIYIKSKENPFCCARMTKIRLSLV